MQPITIVYIYQKVLRVPFSYHLFKVTVIGDFFENNLLLQSDVVFDSDLNLTPIGIGYWTSFESSAVLVKIQTALKLRQIDDFFKYIKNTLIRISEIYSPS